MKSEKTKFFNKLKTYHIFLMSCLLGVIFIINSNYVNEKRAEDKLYQEKNILFNDIIYKRSLEEKGDSGTKENKNSDQVCEQGSQELRTYYKTGDLREIDLSEDDEIKCEDKDSDYMQALIYFTRKFVDKDNKDKKDNKVNKDETDKTEKEDKNESEDDLNNILKLLMNFLPIIIFLVIGILSIIDWFICCCCNCCDCCCCCCCKKPGCKVPCFIFTYIFYGIVIGACVYGLSRSNKIFVGLADTECSFLKLLEQVLEGEVKTTKPKWIGITGINNLLANLTTQINNLQKDTINDLGTQKANINDSKQTFLENVKKFDDECYNKGNYLSKYTTKFDSISIDKYNKNTYVLDIIKMVGHKENGDKEYPEKSFLYLLNKEYSEVAGRTDEYVEKSDTSFNDILKTNFGTVTKSLKDAQTNLDKLKKPFDEMNEQIGDAITKYSGDIDKYGKLGVKILFTALILIHVALAILLLFICLCSMKYCTNCCCCRCLCKTFTHLFWNILALMIILTLLVGSIIAFVGKLGDYGMSLVSYVLSKENFDNKDDNLLIDNIGDAKKYLEICLHGNGSLENEFDLGDSLDRMEDIDYVLDGLDNATQTFNNIKSQLPTFKYFQELIDNRTKYLTDDFFVSNINDKEIFPSQNSDDIIIFNLALKALNQEITLQEKKGESWSINGDKGKKCETVEENIIFHPSVCKPINRKWIEDSGNQDIKDYATIISNMSNIVDELNSEEEYSFNFKLKSLNETYHNYLNSYIDMLRFLNTKIGALIGQIKENVADGNLFSFLNGKFIGTNIKIILKYLKYSLGEDVYKVGMCMAIVGVSLIFSVSSTILLIVIINVALKHNQDKEKEKQLRLSAKGEYSNSEQKIIGKLK